VIFVCIGVLLIGYAYGFFSHRFLWFPYPQIKAAYSFLENGYSVEQLHTKIKEVKVDSDKNLNSDIGRDLSTLVSERRVIESLTIPILATVIDVGAQEGFGSPSVRGPKGGLCSMDSFLVVFDGAGNGILVELNSMTITGKISVNAFNQEQDSEFVRVNDVACDLSQDPTHAYVSYEITFPELTDPFAKFQTKVGKINLQEFQSSTVVEVWSSNLSGQNEAGRLAILSDGKFLISFTDVSGGDRLPNGMFGPEDPSTHMGKLILADASTGGYEIYSKGHRNPQGLFVTDEGGVLETEHGPKGGDELNFIRRGGNYGWPNESHGVLYSGYRWKHGETGRHDNFDRPLFAWVPSIAISNLLKVANFHSTWDGDILIASLKAQSIFRLRLDKERRVEFVERIWIGPRIRDIEETSDARLVLWTDDSTLIFLSIASNFLEENKRTETSYNIPIIKPCLKCHHFGATNITHMAPSLSSIFSRRIASDNYKYSEALTAIEGKWDRETLKRFIMEPQSVAPGSTMTYNVENEEVASEILNLLVKLENMNE